MTRVGKKRWYPWTPRLLREQLRIWELERNIAAIADEYRPKLAKARSEDQEALFHEWDWKSGQPEAELRKIRTNKLLRRAERRGVDLHAEQSWWTEHPNPQMEPEILTDIGLAQAKRLIRNDFRQSVKWVLHRFEYSS